MGGIGGVWNIGLVIVLFMAFVFRSQKRSPFEGSGMREGGKDVEEGQPTEAESQWREKARVCKGMPYVPSIDNNVEAGLGWRQGQSFNTAEAMPIHLRVGPISTKRPMKLRECLPFKALVQQQNLSKLLSASELKPKIQAECKDTASQSNSCLKASQNTKDQKQAVAARVQSSVTSSIIVNKNLKKTLEQLQINVRGYQSINLNKQGRDRQKQNGGQSKGDKVVRQHNWNSLKRLSPIRQHTRLLKSSNVYENGLTFTKKTSLPQVSQKRKLPKRKFLVKPELTRGDGDYEQQQGQYESQATPGPGSYEYGHCQKQKQFRSKREKFQKIFISPLQRFQGGQFKFQQVTYVNDPDAKPSLLTQSKSCQSFLSKSPKFTDAVESQIPPPGYYDTRQNLQHELVRKILRSSNTNTFISRSPRMGLSNPREELPGPGCYNIDRSSQKISEQKGQPSVCFRSQLQRNLECCPRKQLRHLEKPGDIGLCLAKQMQKGKLIHVKDSALEDLYVIQRPPFLTATSRFPDQPRDDTRRAVYPTKQAFPLVHSPAKQPFNSSQKRTMLKTVGEGVGIGLYDMSRKWTKKSYNVLFN